MASGAKPEVDFDAEATSAATLDPSVIQDEYVNLPSTVSSWLRREVKATKAVRLAELELEVGKEQLTLEMRKKAKGPGGEKAMTADEVKASVITHPEYRRLSEAVIAAQETEEEITGVLKSLSAKRDMLVSLGSHIRAEMESGISVRDRSSSRR